MVLLQRHKWNQLLRFVFSKTQANNSQSAQIDHEYHEAEFSILSVYLRLLFVLDEVLWLSSLRIVL